MRIGYLLILLISTVCVSQKTEKNEIDFIITRQVEKDSIINLKIINRSSNSYVLPIMIFPEHEKINYIVGAGDRCLFFIQINVYDENGNISNWICDDCFPEHNTNEWQEIDRLDSLWRERKKNLNLTDLIILKPKETKIFKISFNPVIKVTNRSIFQLTNNVKTGKQYIELSYFGENAEYPAAILPTLEKLAEKENYKIYKQRITSNKVLLKLKD